MTNAAPPTRATNNITLRLGLMPLPVQLFAATEATKSVERKQFVAGTEDPVGYLNINKATLAAVKPDEIEKRVLVGDTWIELTDDEISEATAGAAVDKGDVEITTFVPLASLGGTYLPDTGRLYQVRPAPRESGRKKLPDPHANKLFVLLMAAMKKCKVGALIRVGLRSTARYAVLTPDGMLQFVFFPEEIRAALPIPEVEVTKPELAQLVALIEAIGTSEPEIEDTAKAFIEAFLRDKAAGNTPVKAAPAAPQAVVLDLSAMLEASVAAAKAKSAA